MTATGSLIISTSNRMSRVVDRIRVLNDLADALGRGAAELDLVAERQAQIADQLPSGGRRSPSDLGSRSGFPEVGRAHPTGTEGCATGFGP